MLTEALEIRNHIYVFTTHAPAGAKRCVVPCLALAQSCRQIRREYRPICLKADVSMDWKDVPLYLDQFFPTRDGIVTDIELAPGRMNIFTDNSSAEIDMLTILKFGLANESFDCQFSKGAKAPSDCGVIHEEDDDLSEEDLSTLFNADVDTIKKLLAHRHPHWVADVAEGRIHRLMITQIGTNSYPQAKFHIGQGTDTQLPDEFAKIRERKAQTQMENPRHNRGVANRFHVSAPPHYFDEYVERIRLDNIFLANQYSFLWNYEWIEEDTSCKPVKVKIDAEQNSHYTTGA